MGPNLLYYNIDFLNFKDLKTRLQRAFIWCASQGSNLGPPFYQKGVLPLNYSRDVFFRKESTKAEITAVNFLFFFELEKYTLQVP